MSTDATEVIAQPPEPRPGTTDDKLIPHFDLIGAVPDRIVAKKAGVSLNTVRNFRTHYGIPSSRPVSTPTRSKKAGKAAKSKASAAPKEKGRPGRKSKIKPLHDLVGTMPDEVLAKKAGAAVSTVVNYRREHKIPPFEAAGSAPTKTAERAPRKASKTVSKKVAKAQAAAKGRPGRKSKIAAFSDLIGKVPDQEVAAKAGVQVAAVQAHRRKHKIPAFEATPKAAGVASAKPRRKASNPVPSNGGAAALWGWKVTFATEKPRLAVAPDAARAVEAAANAGLGDVVQVERLIEALG